LPCFAAAARRGDLIARTADNIAGPQSRTISSDLVPAGASCSSRGAVVGTGDSSVTISTTFVRSFVRPRAFSLQTECRQHLQALDACHVPHPPRTLPRRQPAYSPMVIIFFLTSHYIRKTNSTYYLIESILVNS